MKTHTKNAYGVFSVSVFLLEAELFKRGKLYRKNEYLASENTIRDYILCIGVWLRYFHNTVLDTIGLLWNENGCPNAKWISEYEFKKMVNAAHDPTQRMILLLGAKCGLRCGEMSILKDSDFDGSTLTVTGKGHGKGKIRILPLSDFMIAEMKSYLKWKETIKEGRTDRSDGRFLVVTTWRDTHVVSLLSDAIYRKVTAMAAEVGVSCTPHSLRRLFATTMLSHTDLTVVRTLMGHANINTTARYIRNDMNKIREAMNSLGGI